ncbi:proteasome accessory factor A [Jatrophihabitans endophyticus]|uniref:Proteasome accessory factor A n=1 Tax=Jatrophihabitans endophyticus TaxID=1206085 RepID=A0A1M5C1A7_9ACTN|nr:depupylase/deamidase Dop [Jatrophihabitans endophyticus]SHF48232.1 proteasome accessory factor A [Jatrophihabitans endophyticus]
MTVRRVMGTEVEYGVSLPGQPAANAMLLSAQVVNAYASLLPAGRARRASWDFEEESPLRDARGFDLGGGSGTVAQEFIEAEEDAGMANVILPNGARLYVDHAHPEYSSPEVTNPLDAVRWDKAGELVMLEAVRRLPTLPGVNPVINLYKNNTDNKGASYGAHENYLCRRETPFAALVRHLVPFFVTRQVMCGAGRVGRGQDGRTSGFQIAQRADFFEVEVGLETTLKRPIVNTRDEPHADADRYRRLHVIIGDANMSEISTLLKVGTTALVLDMIEAGYLPDDLAISQPVRELHAVSHDPSLRHAITLADGRTITALDLQGEYLDRARKFVDDRQGDDADPQTRDVLERWESVLARLATDAMQLARELDWVAKLRLLEGYRDRDHLDWDAPQLQLVDLQYSDVRPEKGLYHRLVGRGAFETLLPAGAAAAAVTEAPEDTRAYFRGECLRRYGPSVAAASWDSVIFDVGRESLVRVPMLEPLRGTRAHVGELFDRCATAGDLVEALNGAR